MLVVVGGRSDTVHGTGLKAGGDYQLDIYRMMKQSNNNNWEQFNSKTNIFWLHYLLEKMITEVYYKVSNLSA